eukprot:GFYU01013541.1.p1 GENE.GFYU01013541.1~~GFYU01013541.1.p1  ORF type:complete len:139 (-),score=24.52 GFYU01013541.1:716-1132(-)
MSSTKKKKASTTDLKGAAKKGDLDGVLKILESTTRGRVDLGDRSHNTPLYYACAGGYVDIVKALLAADADIDHQNKQGYTPLMTACEHGHVDTVKQLLEAGANASVKGKYDDQTAATLAAKTSVAEELLRLLPGETST